MTQQEILAELNKINWGALPMGVQMYNAIAEVNANTNPPQTRWVGNLTQYSGNDPIVNAIGENSLGGEIVWTRITDGYYYGTLAGAFAGTCVDVQITPNDPDDGSAPAIFNAGKVNDDSIMIRTYKPDGSRTDGQMYQSSIRITVYS